MGNGEMLDAGRFGPVSDEQVASMFSNLGAYVCDSSKSAEFTYSLEGRNVTMKDSFGRSLTQRHLNSFNCGLAGSFGQFIRRSDKTSKK